MSAGAAALGANEPRDRQLKRPAGDHGRHGVAPGHFFGKTAEFWLNLQSIYELRLAERKAGKSIKSLPTLKHVQHAHG